MFKLFSATVLAASLVASPVHAKSKHHHRHHHNSGNVQTIATSIAHQEGVNPALVHAIINVESTGRCHASSSANARGAMQVKPATARSVGVYGNLHDCRTGSSRVFVTIRSLSGPITGTSVRLCRPTILASVSRAVVRVMVARFCLEWVGSDTLR